MKSNFSFVSTYSYRLVYVFKIYDDLHKGILKIGEATLDTDKQREDLIDNCDELNNAAKKRIRQYTNTLGVQEDLIYTTLAIDNKNRTFKDSDVHKVLNNSGIVKHDFDNEKDPLEWYETNLETAKNAIKAVKEGRKCLLRTEVDNIHEDIEFRPEQGWAIDFTLSRFSITDNVLWNAKMRFGKTISALEVVKRMSDSENFKLSKVIILTHRPVVDSGWFEDYTKIFWNRDDFLYGSKNKLSISNLISSGKKFIYFASMQDLRGSGTVGGIYNKNDDVFNTDWDLLIVDEAHEGTQTELGQNVIKAIKYSKLKTPKTLMLSGTPFNLLSEYEASDIFTWDYIMEQKAKIEWENEHPLEPNPYEDLPRMNILTYNLEDYLPQYQEVADSAFNFKEFFRVWTGDTQKDGRELSNRSLIGKFIHEGDVKKFLELLTKQDDNSNYPFSKKEYIDNFRHSFWILPGVKESKALKALMLENTIFSQFDIVNVAGNSDDNGYEALDAVERAIGENPDDTYTITLSCGKLTTGVTVKPWTAVLYLAGSYSTSASSYLQTIFRVQSPSGYGGKQKTNCYVFDFAPDRTLKMIAEAGDLCVKAGAVGSRDRMTQLLNYCPVISINGSEMKPYSVSSMLQQLKQAYVERVVDSGFDNPKIYNDNLLNLNEIDLKKFEKLKGLVGKTAPRSKIDEIDLNNQGFNIEKRDDNETVENKPSKPLTDEQKRLREERRKQIELRNNAILILRGVSIRIPLLIFGANIGDDCDVTIDNFTKIVDDASWEEFMPSGVTKKMFNEFSKYYDKDIFVGAGRRIRNITKYADTLPPVERAIAIANMFSNFRNPDKETVLTPWKTVNKHMSDTLGGYCFFDDKYIVSIENPRFIDNGNVTKNVLLNDDAKILEINSKTGLYPLYITISLFKHKCLKINDNKLDDAIAQEIWNQTVADNIYVICRTMMAKSITRRTLIGYKSEKTNVIDILDITDYLYDNYEMFSKLVTCPKTWHRKGEKEMKFDAIIGNPPYNINSSPIYNRFVEASIKVNPKYISMIMPSRWFSGGRGLNNFRKQMISDRRLSILHDYIDSSECFSNVSIEGGVCYFLWENDRDGKCKIINHTPDGKIKIEERYLSEEEEIDVLIRDDISLEILRKVLSKKEISFSKMVYSRNAFKIDSTYENYFSKVETNLRILARIDNYRQYRYLSDKFNLLSGTELIGKYKIFMSKADGAAGQLGNPIPAKIIGKPEFGMKNDICTETFLAIGPINTKEEMYNVAKYLKTRFCRYLIGIRKLKNMTKSTYSFVPMQNFTNESDIDWTSNIDSLDEQLFKKYDLSEDQIEWIKKRITRVE